MRRFAQLITLATMCGAAPALAYAQDVSIDVQGVAAGVPVEIFMSGAAADRAISGASGSIAADFMSGGKPVDIVIDRCDDMVTVSVMEDGRLLPPDPEDPECDRTVIEDTPWTAGLRLVIDAGRGVVMSNPTIGTQPDVQAAARNVLNALKSEPASEASAGVAAAVGELATIPDTALGEWIPRFRDGFAAIGRQGANGSTYASMEQLLGAVVPRFQRRSSATSADARTPATTSAHARRFRITTSLDYRRAEAGTASAPFVTMRGRFHNPGGPIARDRAWYYSVATDRWIALPGSPGASSGSVLLADPEWDDWIEVTETSGRAFTSFGSLGSRPVSADNRSGFRELSRLVGLVSRIIPTFVRQGLTFRPVSGTQRQGRDTPAVAGSAVSVGLGGARVGSEQGQISLASSPPSPIPDQQEAFARAPQLMLAARSYFEMLRQSLSQGVRGAAFRGPAVRLTIGPGGRREYWIEPVPSSGAPGQAAPDVPRPSMKVFIRSLGRSTGDDAQQAIIINDGNVPVRVVEGEAFATEPLEGVSEQALAKEMEKYAGRPRVAMNLTSYCLNFEKAAPTRGRVYRVAARAAQEQLEPVRRILIAAEQVRDAGELHPDGDPNLYFHSVRQWAIWTEEQRFTERSFAEALLEHTRKNVVAGGRRWTREIESAARAIIPNRWRDVQRVLARARD